MEIREIRPNMLQFMVNPLPVKKKNGMPKKWRGRPVYSSANHLRFTRNGTIVEPHPYSYEFVVV